MDKKKSVSLVLNVLGIVVAVVLLIFIYSNINKIPELVDKLTNYTTDKTEI